ncbi:MAG: LamG domain-containing protein [Ignavibacteriae bacterium]|nr:LamG domain-containing protein [Ignavibacteriota bacterium]
MSFLVYSIRALVILGIVVCLSSATTTFAQGGAQALDLKNSTYLSHGDFVYFGSPNYEFGNTLTVAAWVKWTTDPGSYVNNHNEHEGRWANILTIDKHNAKDNGQFWLQHTMSNQKFEFAVQTTSGRSYIVSTTEPEEDIWYYLVGVYDGSLSSNRMKLYVNGVLEATGNSVSGNIATHSSADRLLLGRLPNGYRLFSGEVDEVRIWKSALTEAQIRQQMYSKSTVGSNLASYWPLDATSGTSVDDQGPSGVDGIFYSALVDVHSYSTSTISLTDDDKMWQINTWSGCTLKTVAGAGVDQTNTVTSNTTVRLYLQSLCQTTPVFDDYGTTTNGGMTWFGIQKESETSQWIASEAPIGSTGPGGELQGFSDVVGLHPGVLTSYLSSILSIEVSSINDGDRILLAHNGAQLAPTQSDVPLSVVSRLSRVWKIEATTSGTVNGAMIFDCVQLGIDATHAGDLVLLVDNDGDFSDASSYYGSYDEGQGQYYIGNVPFEDGFYYTLGTQSEFNTMPVELTSLTARLQDGAVVLQWRTATEKNCLGFEVYRQNGSVNGAWVKLGFVDGSGTTDSPREYQYVDAYPGGAHCAYRLKQIDRDYRSQYSGIVTVAAGGAAAATRVDVSPNPVESEAYVHVALARDAAVTVEVYTVLGARIATLCDQKSLYAGEHLLPLRVSGTMQRGMYILVVKDNTRILAAKQFMTR